jgi:ribosomal protein RSM22 (predicted rRNA methylase)
VEVYHFPEDLEQVIDGVAGAEPDSAEVARAVAELSDLFLGLTKWHGAYAGSATLRRAYLHYYLPVNLPKVRVPLGEWLRADPSRFAGAPLHCLDLGSGPGTALVGLLDFLRSLPPERRPTAVRAVALDQSFESLKDAAALIERVARLIPGLPVSFAPLRMDLVKDRSELFPLAAAEGRFDLVIAANVLCEVARETPDGWERAAGLGEAVARDLLSSQGAMVIVEPGSRDTARDLHRLRDRWLASGLLHVQAPCLHEAPCPALATDRDWCIAELPWQPPRRVASLDRRTGLRKGSLKFSYLVLSTTSSVPWQAAAWRVVSDVLDLKGERRVYLCAEGRWIVLAQLKRAAGPLADALARLRRGDFVEIDGLERKGGVYRFGPGASLRRIEPPPSAALDVVSPG